MSLRDELRKLSSKHRTELMLAFEQETSHYVTIKPGWFVGVNLIKADSMQVVELKGVWSLGQFKHERH